MPITTSATRSTRRGLDPQHDLFVGPVRGRHPGPGHRAKTTKYRRLAEAIDPQARGRRCWRFGCGWGGFGRVSPPKTYGAHVVGLTISTEQRDFRLQGASRDAGLSRQGRDPPARTTATNAVSTTASLPIENDRGGRRGVSGRATSPSCATGLLPGGLAGNPRAHYHPGSLLPGATGARSISSSATCFRGGIAALAPGG